MLPIPLPPGSWCSCGTSVTMGARCSPTWSTPSSSCKVLPVPAPGCLQACGHRSPRFSPADVILLLCVFHFNGNMRQAGPYAAVYPSCGRVTPGDRVSLLGTRFRFNPKNPKCISVCRDQRGPSVSPAPSPGHLSGVRTRHGGHSLVPNEATCFSGGWRSLTAEW